LRVLLNQDQLQITNRPEREGVVAYPPEVKDVSITFHTTKLSILPRFIENFKKEIMVPASFDEHTKSFMNICNLGTPAMESPTKLLAGSFEPWV
jgi:hypothetical protein